MRTIRTVKSKSLTTKGAKNTKNARGNVRLIAESGEADASESQHTIYRADNLGCQCDGTVVGEVDVCGFLDFGKSCERE